MVGEKEKIELSRREIQVLQLLSEGKKRKEIAGMEQTEVVIQICDLSGRVLKSVSEEVSGDFTYSINIEDIPDGTYLCKIESSNAVNTIRFNVVK